MRVALIGYGTVAEVHARGLKDHCELVAVCGPDQAKAQAFADQHGIPYAGTCLTAAAARAQAAIICSPSPLHYAQTKEALRSGIHVLVELPACTSNAEAEELAILAENGRLVLQCAHTSRYLDPYRRFGNWIMSNALGDIRHIVYVRSIPPRARSWIDDALWHHAGHIVDLLLFWFGSLEPLNCAAYPAVRAAQDVSLTAWIPSKAPAAVSVSYTSRLTETKMTVAGSKHTVATDGFTYICSDDARFAWQASEQAIYENAIQEQDIAFCDACSGSQTGIPWSQTIRLVHCLTKFISTAPP